MSNNLAASKAQGEKPWISLHLLNPWQISDSISSAVGFKKKLSFDLKSRITDASDELLGGLVGKASLYGKIDLLKMAISTQPLNFKVFRVSI
jgi:hypothetical protein